MWRTRDLTGKNALETNATHEGNELGVVGTIQNHCATRTGHSPTTKTTNRTSPEAVSLIQSTTQPTGPLSCRVDRSRLGASDCWAREAMERHGSDWSLLWPDPVGALTCRAGRCGCRLQGRGGISGAAPGAGAEDSGGRREFDAVETCRQAGSSGRRGELTCRQAVAPVRAGRMQIRQIGRQAADRRAAATGRRRWRGEEGAAMAKKTTAATRD